jgi:hypothetical protein
MFERMFREGREYAWTFETVVEDGRGAAWPAWGPKKVST